MTNEQASIDWDTLAPSPEAWAALQGASDDDFPQTYSGQAWRAAHRLLKVAQEQPERFAGWDGWTSDELAHEVTRDLDLTGFMFGWAINALRHMMEMPPVADGATVVIGGGDTTRSMPGSAQSEMKRAIGGDEPQP